MTSLPNNVPTVELLSWVSSHPNEAFDPNMIVRATHSTDWQFQAVLGQMEDLRRQNYILRLRQDASGSTYWTITTSGLSYLHALESFLAAKPEPESKLEEKPQSAFSAPDQLVPALPTPKKRVWPFVERFALRLRTLITWEEMPTHLAAHLLYDMAKLVVLGGTFGVALFYAIHLLHQILRVLPTPPK